MASLPEPMSPSIKITKEEINALPLKAYEGPVTLVDKDRQMAQALGQLRKEKVLGFDTESRPSFKRGQNYPASLIQLAGEDHVWLFQIQKLKDLSGLWGILARRRPIKAGVAIADDIEIADLSTQAGILNTGLRSLAGLLLKMRVSKRAQVSNWARSELTEVQIQYAATDAWVSRELYLHVRDIRKDPELMTRTAAP